MGWTRCWCTWTRTPARCFTRTLWRATEDTWRSRPADRASARPSKLLLSCRTHYFRTIRHETTHFTGQHRDGPATVDYLALLMLPFAEQQVRAYLAANLPGTDVDRLLDLIDSVHNLREIAERPLTLPMVAEQLERHCCIERWSTRTDPLARPEAT